MSLAPTSSRRSFIASLGAAALAVPSFPAASRAEALERLTRLEAARTGQAKKKIQVWKNPGCQCCEGWADSVRAAGFEVVVTEDPKLAERRRQLGVPEGLDGCHSGLVDGYVVEGHIPGDIIARFLADPPANALGIAVPGMPAGSPGMESASPVPSYDVIAWYRDGSRTMFATVVPTATQPGSNKH